MWWSFILAGVGVTGLYLTTREGRTRWAGYAVGLAVQFAWIAYALATVQYGFIMSACAYGFVNTLAIRKGIRQWIAQRKFEKRWRIYSDYPVGQHGWRNWWVSQPNDPSPVRREWRFGTHAHAMSFVDRQIKGKR
ncbi:hypothetical protein [Rhodococcus sp. RS1C4]|nr:hypothetical protein [Rhodococcus sp. RS1C4]